jgi:hypothetical protein
MAIKFRLATMALIATWLLGNSVLPASAVKPINCGKPIVPSQSRPIQNVLCSSGAPNLGVRSTLNSQSPKVMSFSKKPSRAAMLNAVCSDLKSASDSYRTQLNIPGALMYQLFAFDLKDQVYHDLLLILWNDSQRADFETNKCSDGLFVGSSNNGASKAQKDAQALVKKNTALQDSCYFTRTSNGDNPTYARQLCIARYPNSLEWALSSNHASEESCYNTRVGNGDNEINARNICLSRYPIRN